MSTRHRTFVFALSAALIGAALPAAAVAGPHRHGGADPYGGWHSGSIHSNHHGYHGWRHGGHHRGHHRGHGGVWGPLIVGGLIGAAIVGASSAQAQVPVQVPVQPVVVPLPTPSHMSPAPVAPPLVAPVVAPVVGYGQPQPAVVTPPRVHYYCSSYGAYYPYVAQCPVPWTPVPY